MTTVYLSPIGNAFQFLTTGGLPLNGGYLAAYQAGTTTPQATYTTSAGNVANANPIPLGVDGRCPNEIWLTTGVAYKFVLTDSLSNIIATYDNISGINDVSVSVITYNEGGTGAVTRTLFSKLKESISVKDFGAVGDGSNDDTAAIQAAINTGAGRIYFPAGTYKITSIITVTTSGTHLEGDGRSATIIAPTAMNSDYFYFNGGTNCSLSGMSIIPTGAQSGSTHAAIHAYLTTTFKASDIHMDSSNIQNGVYFDSGVSYVLEDFELRNMAADAILIGGATLVQDAIISNGLTYGPLNGLHLKNCQGIYLSNIDFIASTSDGINVSPIAAQKVSAVFMSEVLCDTCAQNGMTFYNVGGFIGDISVVNSWFASNTLSGISVSAALDGILISGCRVLNNQKYGMLFTGCKNMTVTGNQIYNNSMIGSADSAGIQVDLAATHFTINSNRIGGPLGSIGQLSSNLQSYAIIITATACDYYAITGNDVSGNVTGTIHDLGTGTHKIITDNPPDSSSSSGVTSFNTRSGAVTLIAADVNTALAASDLDVGGTFRATSLSAPASGAGLEIAYDVAGTTGYIQSYDRTGAAYKGLNIEGSQVTITASSSDLTLVGSVKVPTAAPGDNSTAVASTAFVHTAVSGAAVSSFNTRTGAVTLTSGDVTGALTFTPANIAGDTFTGKTAVSSTFRSTGLSNFASGAGVEIAYDSGGSSGYVQAYDRTGAAYKGLNFAGSQLTFTGGGVESARVESTNGYFLIGYTTSNGAYKLQVNSQIFATNATIATSDRRVKQNIAPLTDGLDAVCKLQPVTFDFIKHPVHNFAETKQVGFIAQDVEEILAGKDYLQSIVMTNDDGAENLKGLADAKIIPLLVNAIKELKAEIDLIKARQQ